MGRELGQETAVLDSCLYPIPILELQWQDGWTWGSWAVARGQGWVGRPALKLSSAPQALWVEDLTRLLHPAFPLVLPGFGLPLALGSL